jgi:hypothetical protein
MKAIRAEDQTEINAAFDLAFDGDYLRITIHARGGSKSSRAPSNPEYEELVQTLLERLRDLGATLHDVLLASKTVAQLSPSKRRIVLLDYAFPRPLVEVDDLTSLRLAIRRAVASSNSTSKHPTHGNATKRIELIASCSSSPALVASRLIRGESSSTSVEPSDEVYLEGNITLRTHIARERNRTLVDRAKAAFAQRHGSLACEVCGFDFRAVYGAIGEGFIEAHHEIPLSMRDIKAPTRIEDLRMVCANCHRMLHRSPIAGDLTVGSLHSLVLSNRERGS